MDEERVEEKIQAALERYKRGEHVHLGPHPEAILVSEEEHEAQSRLDSGIIDAVYAYELKRGGIKVVDGKYEYEEGLVAKLPCYRCAETIHCCL